MAQKIEKVIIEKRIVTISRIDHEEIRSAVMWRMIGFVLLFSLILIFFISYDGERYMISYLGNSVVNLSCGAVLLGYVWWAQWSFRRIKERIMKKWGWDGKKPVEMRVCRASIELF